MESKPTVAVHKFSSCDGCQLALLNLGEDLLTLSKLVDIVHFAEAGPLEPEAQVDIALVEGSIATTEDAARIEAIRANSRYLISIGVCATSGGIQALRNLADTDAWTSAIYAQPDYINSLDSSTPIASQVKVDLELWGCPVNSRQMVAAIRSLLFNVLPAAEKDKVCLECKRQQNVCVMVTKNEPCMGAVTCTGCGALCPGVGRDCYACYGPAENTNSEALANWFSSLGMSPAEIARRFLFINSEADTFKQTGLQWRDKT